MVKVLDMQFIRYANLFERVTKIRTNHCFEYNNTIVFAVPRIFVSKAIGQDNQNLKILSEIIKKKIKIVAIPQGREDIENFVSVITYPVKFKGIEIKDNEAIINAGAQSKAALIGREKCRLEEMQIVLEQYFGIKKVRIK
jgi:transcription antitermination factor NusA-like protein